MEWLRLYTEVLDDPKIAKLSEKSFKVFIFLMCFAQELNENGVINRSMSDIAWRLRMPEATIKKAVKDLIDLGILSCDKCLYFCKWSERQYKSDNSTSRVRRHRAKDETLHETFPETPCNGKRNVIEQIQNRTDTETEKESAARNLSSRQETFQQKEKPKKTKYADSVWLTDEEYKKLQEAMGQKSLDDAISRLDYSITVKSGKYKDHYKTILNWKQRGFLDANTPHNRSGTEATGAYRRNNFTERDAINQAAADEADAITRERNARLAAAGNPASIP